MAMSLRTQPVAALRHIGVVFQQMSLDLDLSVRRNLAFHADLHGLPRALAASASKPTTAPRGLAADLDRAVRELSGGNRRKVELVRALLHRPAAAADGRAHGGPGPEVAPRPAPAPSRRRAARGSTVLWATHLVEEAEAADRVLVLHKGRLLADGTPAAVTAALGGATLEDAFLKATR
jgi:ABC-2 type transport system ATP-binding protein